jgi:REP element-mobilizing transposase RayT
MNALPQRRSPRLQGYDYTQEGAYFVTICTRNRLPLFGEVIDDQVHLNEWGEFAAECWAQIPQHFAHVELDAAVVMPNHVHGILVFVDRPQSIQEAHDGGPGENNGHDSVVSLPGTFGKPVSGSLSSIIRSYKAAVTYGIMKAFPDVETPLWQGRFHDHIIRSQKSLDIIRAYVVNNPARWTEDKFYPA